MVRCIGTLLFSSLAPSTINTYRRAWTLLSNCMFGLGLAFTGVSSLPISNNVLVLFVGYLHLHGYAPTSIISYVCAIGYVHKIKALADPTSTFLVQRLMAAVTKVRPTADTRLPITLTILRQLVLALNHTIHIPYNVALLRAMLLVAFYGLMRVGEITSTPDGHTALLLSQLTFESEHALLVISNFKHNTSGRSFQIVLPKQSDTVLCPHLALRHYLGFRGTLQGPLFCFPGGTPISRNFFVHNLHTLLNFCGLSPTLYKSHSFRIGAASFYAESGMSDEQIRLLGRWKSNAFRKYIRCQRILAALPQ